jgi:hypothetical protein
MKRQHHGAGFCLAVPISLILWAAIMAVAWWLFQPRKPIPQPSQPSVGFVQLPGEVCKQRSRFRIRQARRTIAHRFPFRDYGISNRRGSFNRRNHGHGPLVPASGQ